LLDHIGRQREEKEKQSADRIAAKADRVSKSHDQANSDSQKWQNVVNDLTPGASLDKLSRPELVICHRHLLKKSTTAKRCDIVAILILYWDRDRVIQPGAMAAAPNDPPANGVGAMPAAPEEEEE
jgi:hypothetical protein